MKKNKKAITIGDMRARSASDVVRDCRRYLTNLIIELDKPPLERGSWTPPPEYIKPVGYGIRTDQREKVGATSGESDSTDLSNDLWLSEDLNEDGALTRIQVRFLNHFDEHEQWRQKAIQALDSISHEIPDDRRQGLLGRVLSPSIRKHPDDADLAERVLKMVGPPPDTERALAWSLHAACDHLFRWDLQERVLAALSDMPAEFRSSREACAMHIYNRASTPKLQGRAALLPAKRRRTTIKLHETDLAVFLISKIRDCSRSQAAQEIAAFELHSGRTANLQSMQGVQEVLTYTDAKRDDGTAADFREIRATDSTVKLTKRAREIERNYIDSARKKGWQVYGLHNPWEVLLAQDPTHSHGSPLALAFGSVASLDPVAAEERAEFLKANLKLAALNALNSSKTSPA